MVSSLVTSTLIDGFVNNGRWRPISELLLLLWLKLLLLLHLLLLLLHLLIVLLLLLVVSVFVLYHVGADGSDNRADDCSECSSANLVTDHAAGSSADEGGSETSLAIDRLAVGIKLLRTLLSFVLWLILIVWRRGAVDWSTLLTVWCWCAILLLLLSVVRSGGVVGRVGLRRILVWVWLLLLLVVVASVGWLLRTVSTGTVVTLI